MTTDDFVRASRLLDNETRILREELQRTNLELESYKEKIKEKSEKIKLNKQLRYPVGNIVENVSKKGAITLEITHGNFHNLYGRAAFRKAF